MDLEYERNMERYVFTKWGQNAFAVPCPPRPNTIKVNLEYLAQTVWTGKDQNGETVAYWSTLVATDGHTTMVSGLAVLGWGVGVAGIRPRPRCW